MTVSERFIKLYLSRSKGIECVAWCSIYWLLQNLFMHPLMNHSMIINPAVIHHYHHSIRNLHTPLPTFHKRSINSQIHQYRIPRSISQYPTPKWNFSLFWSQPYLYNNAPMICHLPDFFSTCFPLEKWTEERFLCAQSIDILSCCLQCLAYAIEFLNTIHVVAFEYNTFAWFMWFITHNNMSAFNPLE